MRVRFDTIDIQSRVINKQVKSLLEYGNESWEAAWISRQRTPDSVGTIMRSTVRIYAMMKCGTDERNEHVEYR